MAEGGALGVLILFGGAALDVVLVDPWFQSLVAGTSVAGWDPMTAFLFLHVIPFAASVAVVGAVIGALLGR